MKDLVLPAFAMDCRDWIVVTPLQLGLPDEVGGAPLLALLSSAVLGHDSFRAVNGALSIALPDPGVTTAAICPESPAARLIDGPEDEESFDLIRYMLPTPDRQLALLAEFTTPDGADDEVIARVESLMASFRWAS